MHFQENTGQNGPSGLDLNVEPAWMQGITGQGVVVGLVDDGERLLLYCSYYALTIPIHTGMDWRHRDLIGNYVSWW